MKLSLCILSAFGASEVTATDGFTRLPNMGCHNAYEFIGHPENIEECEAKCAADDECNALLWVHAKELGQSAHCTLHKNCDNIYVSTSGYDDSFVSYKTAVNPFTSTNAPGNTYEFFEHKLCNGYNYGGDVQLDISLAECSAMCSNIRDCKGLSYVPDFSENNNTCFLKTDKNNWGTGKFCDDLEYAYKTTTLLPKDWTENYTLLSGQKCNDAVFHQEVVVNFDHCLSKCKYFERCRTVTYQPGEEQNLCLFQDEANSCEDAEGGFEAAIKHEMKPTTPYERALKINNDILVNMWKGGIHGDKMFTLNVRLRLDVIMHNANIKYEWFRDYKDCDFPEHWDWKNYQQWLEEQDNDRYNREDPCKATNQLFLGLDRWFTIFTKNCAKKTERQQYAFKNRQMKKITSTRNRIFKKMECTQFINKYDL